jgi:lysine 6-dehydrogenase
MRIIILGTGGVGTVIAQDLGEDPDISQIVLADADLAKAKKLEERIANAAAHLVDTSKVDQLEPLLRGFHLVINALPPEFNQNVMRAFLNNKAHYLDMTFGTDSG